VCFSFRTQIGYGNNKKKQKNELHHLHFLSYKYNQYIVKEFAAGICQKL